VSVYYTKCYKYNIQCTFRDCSAVLYGGSIFASIGGTFLIDSCYFSGSSAASGGALSLSTTDNTDDSSVHFDITRSEFEDNIASDDGNAIDVTSGVLSLTFSSVSNHFHRQNVAVFTAAAMTYVADSLFHDNSGGAISTGGTLCVQLDVIRSNFSNNFAPDIASAINSQANLFLNEVRLRTLYSAAVFHY
jgi:hypothetical protein